MTAEQCAYLSKAYVFFHDYKKAVKYAKKSVKLNPGYAYGYIRLAFAYGKQAKKKSVLKILSLLNNSGVMTGSYRHFLHTFITIQKILKNQNITCQNC